jgi:hypothetical protein
VPVGITGHRTQQPRGQVGPPGPHPAGPCSSLDPGGERWPIPRPLAPLIAQLVGSGKLTNLDRFETPKPHPQHGKSTAEVLVPTTSRDPRWAGGWSTPDSTTGTRSAKMSKKALQWHSGDSKKFLVLFLWRFDPFAPLVVLYN